MNHRVLTVEPTSERRVFRRWSIEVPESFAETFVTEDGYWHAWDETRSVSLSSVALLDHAGRPAPTDSLLKDLRPPRGARVAVPGGLAGWAVIAAAPHGARASRALSGLIAVEGGVLIATITSNDVRWATDTWMSVRHRTPGPLRVGIH